MRNLRRFLSMLASVAMLISMLSIATASEEKETIYTNEKTICSAYGFSAVIKADGSLWIWGETIITQNGNNPRVIETPYKLANGVRSVFASDGGNLYFIKNDNSLWGCGYNSHGEVGVPGQDIYNFPVKIMDNVLSGDAGYEFVGVVTLDHSYYTWGSNEFGQLGTDMTGNYVYNGTTCQNVPLKVMENIKSNSATQASAAIITLNSALLTCGSNVNGQLGNGEAMDLKSGSYESLFVATFCEVAQGVRQVSSANNIMAVIKNDDTVWTCGYNDNGKLGFGNKNGQGTMEPLVVPILTKITDNAFDICTADNNTYVLKKDGSLWGTGSNRYGQLGTGFEGQKLNNGLISPKLVSSLTLISNSIIAIDSRMNAALALKSDGTCVGWGSNFSGELLGKHNIALNSYLFCQSYPVPIITGVKLPSNSLRQAKLNPSAVMLDGNSVNMNMYTIYSETGGGTNLVKLRDVAYLLSNTQANFEVSWDQKTSTISITTGKAYTAVGGEMQAGTAGDKIAVPTSSKILVDGQEVNLTGYTIGANNYFALRYLGQALGFNVTWDGKVIIESDKPYQG